MRILETVNCAAGYLLRTGCRHSCSSTAVVDTATPLPRLLDLRPAQLPAELASVGLPAFRAKQIMDAVFRGRATTFADIKQLSLRDQATLSSKWQLGVGTAVQSASRVSADGTRKYLVDTGGGAASRVESVLIPGKSATDVTVCVSSQAGCSLRCAFCYTGTQALEASLRPSDIISQVLIVRRDVASPAAEIGPARARPAAPSPPQLLPAVPSRVVFMGQGEPLMNWRAVSTAIEYLVHPAGCGMAPHRITLSTAGVAPRIPLVARDTPGVRLAVSLHAPDDATRGRIMDINARWPLREVLSACAEFVRLRVAAVRDGGGSGGLGAGGAAGSRSGERGVALPSAESDSDDDEDDGIQTRLVQRRGDPAQQLRSPRLPALSLMGTDRHNGPRRVRVSFEYVMLEGVNDSPAQAAALATLLRSHLPSEAIHINLILFNAWPGSPFTGSPLPAVHAFQSELLQRGLRTTVRASKGGDVLGACGQLRSSARLKPPPFGGLLTEMAKLRGQRVAGEQGEGLSL